MKNSTIYISAGGAVVAIGGYFTYRKLRQSIIAKKVVEAYEKDKLIVGPMLYMAAFGTVPKAPLDMTQVNAAALTLAKMTQPVIGFGFPSKNDVIVFAQKRALQVAQNDPKALALLAIQQGGDIINRLQKELGGK